MMDARELWKKIAELTPPSRYFLINDKQFDRFCSQQRISHVEIRHYQLSPNLWLKVYLQLKFFTSPSIPATNDSLLEAKREFVAEWLARGEYSPETQSWTGKPIPE